MARKSLAEDPVRSIKKVRRTQCPSMLPMQPCALGRSELPTEAAAAPEPQAGTEGMLGAVGGKGGPVRTQASTTPPTPTRRMAWPRVGRPASASGARISPMPFSGPPSTPWVSTQGRPMLIVGARQACRLTPTWKCRGAPGGEGRASYRATTRRSCSGVRKTTTPNGRASAVAARGAETAATGAAGGWTLGTGVGTVGAAGGGPGAEGSCGSPCVHSLRSFARSR